MSNSGEGAKTTAAAAPNPLLESFLALGLDQHTAENAHANCKVTANLTAVIAEAGVTECDKSVGNLLYTVATKYPASSLVHRPDLIKYIMSAKIKNSAQLDAALSFLSNLGPDSWDVSKFEEAYCVGVIVSLEDIQSTVTDVLNNNMEAIVEQRYHINVGTLCGQVRKKHPWGDAKFIKEEIEKRLADSLGPKTEADNVKHVKKKREKPAIVEDKKVALAAAVPSSVVELDPFSIFPHPEENFKKYIYGNILKAYNTKGILEMHLKATGGKVMTRFPPELNGYLHIGHAKAMNVDFGLAKERNGHCYLRFDDTNPEAEKKEYIDHIQEIVRWMGWEPYKVTYTSDYFQEFDNRLIRIERLEYHIREELNRVAPQAMVVLHPLKVVITNLEHNAIMNLDAKMWPDASEGDTSAFYKVPFSKTIYIEQFDFRLEDSKDYFGLAPDKSVMLRYAFPIKCTEVIYGNNSDNIIEVRAEYDPSKATIPKGVLHWVAEPFSGVEPLKIEVRLFEKLFLSEDPAELEDWLSDLNPRSKEVIENAYAVPSLASAVLGDKFQFERPGYFAVDSDSTPEKLVFNRTVTLKDPYGKAGPK